LQSPTISENKSHPAVPRSIKLPSLTSLDLRFTARHAHPLPRSVPLLNIKPCGHRSLIR
jgi:hypothetical protein